MLRLLVSVEGQTEETFVSEVLRPHLRAFGYGSVNARLMGNPRLRIRRGGVRRWPGIFDELTTHLREDRSVVLGVMVDYYGMPASGNGGWPGRQQALVLPVHQRAHFVEEAISREVGDAMGPSFDRHRFIPGVVMHEYEGLLFSDCQGFARAMGRLDLAPSLQAIRDQFQTPEEINDSPVNAPSIRVHRIAPGYEKPLSGVRAARLIGLATIVRECPHFANWISRLENVGEPPTSPAAPLGLPRHR